MRLYEYTKYFDRTVSSEDIRLCHYPTPPGFFHTCDGRCLNYPLQTCSNVCGVVCIVMSGVATFDQRLFSFLCGPRTNGHCYLNNPTRYEKYLRMVLINWFMTRNISIRNISLKVYPSRNEHAYVKSRPSLRKDTTITMTNEIPKPQPVRQAKDIPKQQPFPASASVPLKKDIPKAQPSPAPPPTTGLSENTKPQLSPAQASRLLGKNVPPKPQASPAPVPRRSKKDILKAESPPSAEEIPHVRPEPGNSRLATGGVTQTQVIILYYFAWHPRTCKLNSDISWPLLQAQK